jgi:sugar phosphate isomerase/epimerase
MKISLTYLYTISRYGYPPAFEDDLRALSEIRKLGFHYLEMEGLGPKHLRTVYQNRKQLRKTLNDCGLHVHNFCIIDKDLVSAEDTRRKRAYDRFKLGAELGDFLGAETLHLASYAPPVRFLGAQPYQLAKNNGYSFVNYLRIRIPPRFEWNAVWDRLVHSCRFCAEVAAQHGKIVLMEPRVGEVICSVDSLLRLIEQVGCGNFKANFDTAHFSAQRENVALGLMKLRGKFANVHLADNNPVNADHLPIGRGIIDWQEFFRVLKSLDYEGYLGLDLGRSRTLVEDYRKSVQRIQAIARPLKIPIEF